MKTKIELVYHSNGRLETIDTNSDIVFQGSVATSEFYLKIADNDETWLPTDSVFISFTRADTQKSGPLLMRYNEGMWKYISNGWLEDVDLGEKQGEYSVSIMMRRYSTLDNKTVVAVRTSETITLPIAPSANWTPKDLTSGEYEAITSAISQQNVTIEKVENFQVGTVTSHAGEPGTQPIVNAEIISGTDPNRYELNMDLTIPQGEKGDPADIVGAVAGVKGNNETEYRQGLVNLTPEDLGALRPQDVSNPNLVINPNFTINQRGVSTTPTIFNRAYCVDRWYCSYLQVSIDENSNLIVTNTSQVSQYFYEPIEELNTLVGQQLTYTMAFNDGNKYISTFTLRKESIQQGTTETSFGRIYVYYDTAKGFYFGFLLNAGQTISPKYAKLEVGSIATAFSPPNIIEELLKCRYYYNKVYSAGRSSYQQLGFCYAESATRFRFIVPGQMRRSPTITYSGNFAVLSPSNSNNAVTDMAFITRSTLGTVLVLTVQSNVTARETGMLQTNNDTTAYIALDAEL